MDIEGLQVRAVSLFEDPTKKEYNTLSILVYVEIDAIEDMTKKYEICSCFDKTYPSIFGSDSESGR